MDLIIRQITVILHLYSLLIVVINPNKNFRNENLNTMEKAILYK